MENKLSDSGNSEKITNHSKKGLSQDEAAILIQRSYRAHLRRQGLTQNFNTTEREIKITSDLTRSTNLKQPSNQERTKTTKLMTPFTKAIRYAISKLKKKVLDSERTSVETEDFIRKTQLINLRKEKKNEIQSEVSRKVIKSYRHVMKQLKPPPPPAPVFCIPEKPHANYLKASIEVSEEVENLDKEKKKKQMTSSNEDLKNTLTALVEPVEIERVKIPVEKEYPKEPGTAKLLQKPIEEAEHLKKLEEAKNLKKPVEAVHFKKLEQTEPLKNPVQSEHLKKSKEAEKLKKPKEVEHLKNPKNAENLENSKKAELLKKPVEAEHLERPGEKNLLKRPVDAKHQKKPKDIEVQEKSKDGDEIKKLEDAKKIRKYDKTEHLNKEEHEETKKLKEIEVKEQAKIPPPNSEQTKPSELDNFNFEVSSYTPCRCM